MEDRLSASIRTQRLSRCELLYAPHSIPDSERGITEASSGISLCKIHHAAFDKNILGINEDYRIEVRQDILEEIDGPMLKYGLQGLQHQKVYLPGRKHERPGKVYIRKRYENFLKIE
mgnify:CR=1 FL=1